MNNPFPIPYFSIILGTLFLVGMEACGPSSSAKADDPELDGQRAAELFCESVEVARKATTGELDLLEESARLAREANELYTQLEAKYTSAAQAERFLNAYNKGLNACP